MDKQLMSTAFTVTLMPPKTMAYLLTQQTLERELLN